jgi:hypothetical protein
MGELEEGSMCVASCIEFMNRGAEEFTVDDSELLTEKMDMKTGSWTDILRLRCSRWSHYR